MGVVIMLGLTMIAAVMAAMCHALNNKLGIVLLGHIGELFRSRTAPTGCNGRMHWQDRGVAD